MHRRARRFRNRFVIGAGEFQAASMSDLAFLLLIFFVVSTVFAIESGVVIPLPSRGASPARVKRQQVVQVRAFADRSLTVDGNAASLADVRARVAARTAVTPDLIVILMTAPDADYGFMVDVLDEIKLANCRRISLKTLDT